jgi:glycerol-3-phosphate acyltransferase PlsX
MLLGVEGVCIISHGSSNSQAMLNAIKLAHEMVEHRLVDEIRAAVALHE